MKSILYLYLLSLFLYSTTVASQTIDENIQRELSEIKYDNYKYSDEIVDKTINFNENWKFRLGDNTGFQLINFDDSNWRRLCIPHDWSIEGQINKNNISGTRGGFYPMGKGCYRKVFKLLNNYIGKRIRIRFDGVYMNSVVFVNGKYIGNRPYGFSSFSYDISNFVKFGDKENIIAVSVDNSLQPNCRWYTGSGINRNVFLQITEQQHFDKSETFFRSIDIKNDVATVKVDAKIISNNYKDSKKIKFQLLPNEATYIHKNAVVNIFLKDKNNNIVSQKKVDFLLKDYSIKKISEELYINKPILWSDKNPYLYKLELSLVINGVKTNVDIHNVGIRKIEFDCNNGMRVNGEKTIVKGVCLHKDGGSFGTAVPKELWVYRLNLLKEMGCNAIRCHGPVDPVFLDICDSLGFYFMSEAFDEWNKNWEYGYSEDAAGKVAYGYHQYFNQWAKTDLTDMIRRDRNHPSVFIYSLGNEVPEQRYDEGLNILTELRDIAHKTDNTRPVTVGCDWSMWANKTGFMDSMDIAGYNYPDRYYTKLYEEQHKQYPNRILLGTENSINLNNWLAVKNNKYVVGMFLWVGIDYIGESIAWPRKNWEWGLIDIASTPKSFYYTWQAYWSEKPIVHISAVLKNAKSFKWRPIDMRSHWTFNKEDIDSVYVYSNQTEVELFLNGKSLGRKKVAENQYKVAYKVNYEPGELIAVALNNNKIVSRHVIRTSQSPEKLAIINKNLSKKVKAGDICAFNVEVQDAKGVIYPYSNAEITIDIEGGELLGIDSGDPYSHEIYKKNSRMAYEGKLFIVARVCNYKKFTLKCHSNNLKSVKFNF